MHRQLVTVRKEAEQSAASAASAEASATEGAAARRRAEANAGQAAENLRAAEPEVDLVSQQNEQMFRYVSPTSDCVGRNFGLICVVEPYIL